MLESAKENNRAFLAQILKLSTPYALMICYDKNSFDNCRKIVPWKHLMAYNILWKCEIAK